MHTHAKWNVERAKKEHSDGQTWNLPEVAALMEMPFNDLLFRAHQTHRENFNPNEIQLSTLLSIKTGGCPEDCKYCPQSARYPTGVQNESLMNVEEVIAAARLAKASGATRFCMGAAWRGPKDRDFDHVLKMIDGVKALGLETCVTLGLLKHGQAERLKAAGLDFYNHNIDTSSDFYGAVVTTRLQRDRFETLEKVRNSGIQVCCGGIVGMGETRSQRAGLIAELANLRPQPESVPINLLVQVKGTPMHGLPPLDPLEFVRTVATVRICMPKAYIRLSAGRRELGFAIQALCYFAGANSIFYGNHLLTTENPDQQIDDELFQRLGIVARKSC